MKNLRLRKATERGLVLETERWSAVADGILGVAVSNAAL
jgi:hypothetical protein